MYVCLSVCVIDRLAIDWPHGHGSRGKWIGLADVATQTLSSDGDHAICAVN